MTKRPHPFGKSFPLEELRKKVLEAYKTKEPIIEIEGQVFCDIDNIRNVSEDFLFECQGTHINLISNNNFIKKTPELDSFKISGKAINDRLLVHHPVAEINGKEEDLTKYSNRIKGGDYLHNYSSLPEDTASSDKKLLTMDDLDRDLIIGTIYANNFNLDAISNSLKEKGVDLTGEDLENLKIIISKKKENNKEEAVEGELVDEYSNDQPNNRSAGLLQ